MKVVVNRNFTWSYSGRLVNYKQGQVIEVESKVAEKMIKFEYASLYEEKHEQKMFKHEVIEDKMMHVEIEDKSAAPKLGKKSKKAKDIENE